MRGSRSSSRATIAGLLTVAGNASGITGTVDAPGAGLSESGNGAINGSLIVDTLTISGNAIVGPDTLTKNNLTRAVLDPATLNKRSARSRSRSRSR